MMRDPRYDAESECAADMRPASWWFVLSTLWGHGYYAMLCESRAPAVTSKERKG